MRKKKEHKNWFASDQYLEFLLIKEEMQRIRHLPTKEEQARIDRLAYLEITCCLFEDIIKRIITSDNWVKTDNGIDFGDFKISLDELFKKEGK